MKNMVTVEGTHGTSQKAASDIQKGRFDPKMGRAGKGAYFWHMNAWARQLAIDWAKSKQRTPTAILYCSIACEETRFFDLENQKAVDAMAQLSLRRGNEDAATFIAYYVTLLEKNIGTECAVIMKKVAPPQYEYTEYPIGSLGAPLCYIVRDVSTIRIDRREDI